jgi:hypothetical protein
MMRDGTLEHALYELGKGYENVAIATFKEDLMQEVPLRSYTSVFDFAPTHDSRKIQRYLGKQGINYDRVPLNATEPWSIQVIGDTVSAMEDAYQADESILINDTPELYRGVMMGFLWLKYRGEDTDDALSAIWGDSRENRDAASRVLIGAFYDPARRVLPPCLPEVFTAMYSGENPGSIAEKRTRSVALPEGFDPALPGREDPFGLKKHLRR